MNIFAKISDFSEVCNFFTKNMEIKAENGDFDIFVGGSSDANCSSKLQLGVGESKDYKHLKAEEKISLHWY